MTEQQWLCCRDPVPMLEFLKSSDRKLRLFACACCRQIHHLVQDEAALKAIQASEQYADGLATKKQVRKAQAALELAIYGAPDAEFDAFYAWRAVMAAVQGDATSVVSCATWTVETQEEGKKSTARTVDYRPDWSALLRDVVGNPFRPITLESVWLTPAVVALAQSIYDDRNFDVLPILADALEEAGCANPEILSHCRGLGPHAKGCWAVDLLLEKE